MKLENYAEHDNNINARKGNDEKRKHITIKPLFFLSQIHIFDNKIKITY